MKHLKDYTDEDWRAAEREAEPPMFLLTVSSFIILGVAGLIRLFS